jgi:hypothetical protein
MKRERSDPKVLKEDSGFNPFASKYSFQPLADVVEKGWAKTGL